MRTRSHDRLAPLAAAALTLLGCSLGADERTSFDCHDFDGDGYWTGQECPQRLLDLGVGWDCDDERNDVFPGAAEVCDGADNACLGEVDRHPVGEGNPCDTLLPAPCNTGNQYCVEGRWTCRANGGTAEPRGCNGVDDDCDGFTDEDLIETCDGTDDDCDGTTDEGFPCAPLGAEQSCTTDCRLEGRRTCSSSCDWGPCLAPAEFYGNGCDDDGDTDTDECEPEVPGAECSLINDCGCRYSYDDCRPIYWSSPGDCYVQVRCEYSEGASGGHDDPCPDWRYCSAGHICLSTGLCARFCRTDADCPSGSSCTIRLQYGGDGSCDPFTLEGVRLCN